MHPYCSTLHLSDSCRSNYIASGVSITFLVSGWFCEVGGCGKKGAVKEFIKIFNVQEEAEHTEKGLLDMFC